MESVAEPTGETWLVQLRNAAKAGVAPADVSMMGGFSRLRGASEELWLPLDESKMPNATKYLDDSFVYRYDDGRLYGSAARSLGSSTLCSNTDVFAEAPTSWADMWDPKYEDSLGLLALATNSYLLDITAATFFDPDAITTQEGIEKVLAKLSEVKPNVRLWYKDEGTFQQALQDGEVPMGQYYHDVTELARADGFPGALHFPQGRRRRRLRRLVGQQGVRKAGRGGSLHGTTPRRRKSRPSCPAMWGPRRSWAASTSTSPTRSSRRCRAISRRSSRSITSISKWAIGSATAGPR